VKSLLLLSGGLDSAVCLASIGGIELCLGVDYGQNHLIELTKAKELAEASHIEYIEMKIERLKKADDLVFAGRNLLLIALAASVAQSRGIHQIIIGCNKSDYEMFPDCRGYFLTAASIAVSAYNCILSAPLINRTKAEVVSMAKEAGIPIGSTWTCYSPIKDNPCGMCYACTGLRLANV